mmetsp:Transcript_4105/g.6132  ORF Transcript_4105/g.6132 Transcript_4105/m.6132 type:complete len:143 (-) Transcript_4105:386-814(-)
MMRTKIEVLKKAQRIELQHAKLYAAREAETMLKEKLRKAREAYDSEYDQLCHQHENLMREMERELKDKNILKNRIVSLEQIISEQNNLIETTGYKLRQNEREQKPKNVEERMVVNDLAGLEKRDEIPKKAAKFIGNSKDLLK